MKIKRKKANVRQELTPEQQARYREILRIREEWTRLMHAVDDAKRDLDVEGLGAVARLIGTTQAMVHVLNDMTLSMETQRMDNDELRKQVKRLKGY